MIVKHTGSILTRAMQLHSLTDHTGASAHIRTKQIDGDVPLSKFLQFCNYCYWAVELFQYSVET